MQHKEKEEKTEITEIPYIHPNFDLADIWDNGKILSDAEIAAIKADDGLIEGRNNKKKLRENPSLRNLQYDIIKKTDETGKVRYLAIYKGRKFRRSLGAGATGSVRLVQDIETGEQMALKKVIIKSRRIREDGRTYVIMKQHIEDSIRREQIALKKMNQLIFSSYQRTKPSMLQPQSGPIEQSETVIALAKGMPLNKVKRNPEKLSALRLLDISLSVLKSVQAVHDNGLVHRDVKPENIHVDLASGEASLVDFGIAADKNIQERIEGFNQQGTLEYMSPEMRLGTYSPESDRYAAAITIADTLGLTKSHDDLTLKTVEDISHPKHHSLITPVELERKILNFLHEMTSFNPADRPSDKEVLAFFNQARQEYIALNRPTIEVAFLEVNRYLSANNEQKSEIIDALKKQNEVYLIDDKSVNNKHYVTIKRELEAHGIIVKNEVVHYPEAGYRGALAKYKKELEAETSCTYHCVHVTINEGKVSESEITPWAIGKSARPKKEEVQFDALIQEKNRIVQELTSEAKRLGSQNKKSDRHQAIVRTINTLDELARKGELTQIKMSLLLNNLQKEVRSKKPVVGFLQKHGLFVNSQEKSILTVTENKDKKPSPPGRK